jgi:hypothetical protein
LSRKEFSCYKNARDMRPHERTLASE